MLLLVIRYQGNPLSIDISSTSIYYQLILALCFSVLDVPVKKHLDKKLQLSERRNSCREFA